jgi:hypothetical protein
MHQQALGNVLKRGARWKNTSIFNVTWETDESAGNRQTGMIRIRAISVFLCTTGVWISPSFAVLAIKSNITSPTVLHLACLVPLRKKLMWMISRGLLQATQNGCVARTPTIVFDPNTTSGLNTMEKR